MAGVSLWAVGGGRLRLHGHGRRRSRQSQATPLRTEDEATLQTAAGHQAATIVACCY
eukprot:COSAG01_NODE_1053_length_11913_cov_4.198307_10_plen_57_part_00